MAGREVTYDTFCDPTASGHDDGACLHLIDFAFVKVRNPDECRFLRLSFVLDTHHSRSDANPNLLSRAIQSGKIYPISADPFERARPGNGFRNEGLYDMPREA